MAEPAQRVKPPAYMIAVQAGTLVSIVTGLVWFGTFRGDAAANFARDDRQQHSLDALVQTSAALQSAIAGLASTVTAEREAARREIDQIHSRLAALERSK